VPFALSSALFPQGLARGGPGVVKGCKGGLYLSVGHWQRRAGGAASRARARLCRSETQLCGMHAGVAAVRRDRDGTLLHGLQLNPWGRVRGGGGARHGALWIPRGALQAVSLFA